MTIITVIYILIIYLPKNLENIIPFEDPSPAREISMIYSKSQLKLPVINALMTTISSVIRGQIKYNDIKDYVLQLIRIRFHNS